MSERQVRKGDCVQFQYLNRVLQGVVKEDRGPIGIKGRHLYLVEFRHGPEAPISQAELPAEEFEPAQQQPA
jgi:hypothetical protein